jgi:type I restriction enzyme S subunit
MSKQKLIPELRFPEFVNEGEWDVIELNELGVLINGLTYSPDDVRKKGLLVLRSSNVQNGLIDFNDCVYVRTDIPGANLSKPNDILVCVRNGSKNLIGKNAIIPKGLPLATHGAFMTIFRATNPEFVFQLFQTDFYDTQVKADLGATINSINGKNFLKYEFPVPENTQEQQKIASCLSSLDEVIAAHSQKLALLKDHKKGLMQNLFPQAGENVPKYRFPEFEEDGEWGKSKLTEHIDLLSGFAFQSIFFSEMGKKLLTPKNFTKNGAADFNNGNTKYTTEVCDRKYICSENDLLLLLTDLTPSCELLGKPVMLKKHDGEVLLNQRIVKVLFKSDFHRGFLLQFFLTDIFHQRMKDTASGSTVRHSSNKIVLDTELYYPLNPKEQQKIASCLSSLDALITAQAEQIAQLKLHKKGLMQGLFPKIKD